MEVDPSYAATNHDRQKGHDQAQTGAGQIDARTSANGEAAAQAEPGNAKPDLDPIFKDVGKSFRIGRTSKADPFPPTNLKSLRIDAHVVSQLIDAPLST